MQARGEGYEQRMQARGEGYEQVVAARGRRLVQNVAACAQMDLGPCPEQARATTI